MKGKVLRIFYSGIGGSGMSALAMFDAGRGHEVSGSDRAFDRNPAHPAHGPLRAKGIKIVPQDGSGIHSALDFAVMSTAVEDGNPEVVRARELGVPIKRRPEYLAEIVSEYRTVAVSGTSGKSTASGMLAFAMERLGMGPNFLGGGRVKQFRTKTNPGNSLKGGSDLLVIEACESDGSIVRFHPEHTIILNLSLDHMGVEETSRMFRALAANTSGRVFINADDDNLTNTGITGKTFSIDRRSDLRAEALALRPLGSEFAVRGARFKLRQPGRHNIYNALSALSALLDLGAPLDDCARALSEFQGIERRFDILLDGERGLVIDDYAHNPHKIRALMETLRGAAGSICYVFQPHGFAPTRLMKEGYIDAFCEGLRPEDRLVILPIYYAGGTASRDITSRDVAGAVAARGKAAEAANSREEILEDLGACRNYVVFGARDETLADFAREIARRLEGK